MEFEKRHDTTDTTDCPCQLVNDLSFILRTCCGLATGKLPACYVLSMVKLILMIHSQVCV